MKMSKNNGKERIRIVHVSIWMRILGRPLNRWHKNVPDRKIMMWRKRR
jgi:hypothetical protein